MMYPGVRAYLVDNGHPDSWPEESGENMSGNHTAHVSWLNQPIGRSRNAAAVVDHAGSSTSAWILVASPAVYFGLIVAALNVGFNDPIAIALSASVFYLLSVALAAVDEYTLRSAGHTNTASPYWALLTSIPYLSARTSALVEETGRGLTVLWAGIGVVVVTIAATLYLIAN